MRTKTYRITKGEREQLVRGLGWFSIGLGALEIAAPHRLSRWIGAEPSPNVMRLMGLREMITGIGILSQPDEPGWLQARVAGDAMDLGLLGVSMFSEGSERGRLGLAAAAVAGVTALDILAAQDLRASSKGRGVVDYRKSLIINRSPEELYSIWHDFERLPQIMRHLYSVRSLGDGRMRWVAKGPAGSTVEWDAEITEDRPNELISWRSLEHADVDNRGSVQFERAPGNRGTILRVELQYRPPAGALGAKVAKLLAQSPEKQIAVDLIRFKQMVETGEIARTEGQSSGRSRSTSRKYDDLIRN
ncbi:MAG TPA: SRPBCC family protein [Verrucomicrobiae bacterium]|nr:SRPBCC family protein [Verrucomicrobiae bacterium]